MYSRQEEPEEQDWEITTDGLFIATRTFLTRRGFCCGCRCRNCPYINWRNQAEWQPIRMEQVKRIRVSPRSTASAQGLLRYHQKQLRRCPPHEQLRHQTKIEYYTQLLERWGFIT
jgi:hypothetical protein